ncbi:helix-turn-helix transcriptional regulator [Vibrio viridaestus]|uniref:LuxR family transcriptional regulator n=1 Tax=Vibrio viridaestus TaxID=2487322 RepID=A0A3N9TB89_9VIBR|nr:helix-turn-helix transcriptional regulator [Vibrio viridaestus]RQW61023.1 LuxR family transcriptional regulator [Vibrio viridaestus]
MVSTRKEPSTDEAPKGADSSNVIIVDGCELHISGSSYINGVRAVMVTYTGVDGWGVSVAVPELDILKFKADTTQLNQFISFAKSKLGLSERSKFTDRELDIIFLIERNVSNVELAKRMHLSVHTIKSHLQNIFKKANVKNRGELIDYAMVNIND